MQALDRLHNNIVIMTGWQRWAVAFAAGVATALATAPFHLFAVCFVTFPLLIWLLDGAVPPVGAGMARRMMPAFAIGWWFGFGYFLAGLWWIANALLVEAREFLWFVPFAVVGLPAILAVFYALATSAARLFWSDGVSRIAMMACMFGLAELARANVLTGFPWNAIGYAIAPTPILMQSASVIGIAGLNVIAVLVFAMPAAFVGSLRSAIVSAFVIAAILGAHAGYGIWRLAAADSATPTGSTVVRIVQPSIDQSIKTGGLARDEQLARLLDLTSQPSSDGITPDIIVWPETSVPYILTQSPDTVSAIAARLVPGQVLMAGAVRIEGDPADEQPLRYYNSILVVDDEGVIIDAADKVHLVPFGEYLPLKSVLEAIGLRAIATADRGYVGAPSRSLLHPTETLRFLPLICYEAIFSRHALDGALQADAIVTVSNDAWFGNTPGPHQHAHHAQLRSVETGMAQIRVANSGISTMFDAYGRPQIQPLRYGEIGAAQAELPKKLTQTAFVAYGQYYHWLLLLVTGLFGLTGFTLMRRANRRR